MTRTFRKGDRVLVPGVVRDIEREGLIQVTVTEGAGFGWKGVAHVAVDPNTLVMKEPAPPQVGDSVIHKDNESETFKVLAINGLSAWVRSEGGHMYSTVLIANLTVVRVC